ncbi:MAG: FAD-binding oxidoreductase, partial [Leptolyngbya sp. SIO1D8]|nr:FAD-binding oxidoreductase [Leptolyngbya sp. SIO1D8]
DLDTSLKPAVQGAIAADSPPVCIAYPETPDQLAEVVACAHQNQWRLLPCGHGSKLSWGSLLSGVDLVVSTQRLNQVIEHAVGDLTVTAEAGVSFADLQERLQRTRQFLAIDPAYAHQATLGGIVATRDTGALRQRYGGIRDMLIGVSFVRYDGQQAKAGGRVVKNVAGYDLMKLMTGSFGTLAVLTQLTFRTYPGQETSKTVVLKGSAAAIQAVTAEIRLSSLTPVAMDLLSPDLLLENKEANHYGLALQFQSIDAGVAEQVERLQAIALPHGLALVVLADEADPQFWQQVRTALFPNIPDSTAAIAKIGTAPTQAMSLLTHLQSTLTPGSWQSRIHASSGLGTLRLTTADNRPEQVSKVRSHCQAVGGHLTLLEAPPAWKMACDSWALSASTKGLMTRLRNQFDPQRHLSPGRFS